MEDMEEMAPGGATDRSTGSRRFLALTDEYLLPTTSYYSPFSAYGAPPHSPLFTAFSAGGVSHRFKQQSITQRSTPRAQSVTSTVTSYSGAHIDTGELSWIEERCLGLVEAEAWTHVLEMRRQGSAQAPNSFATRYWVLEVLLAAGY